MKIITLIIALLLSFNVLAECRPDYEADIAQRLILKKKWDKIGKKSTIGTFVVVGGYYGYLGWALTGPIWAGVVIGSSFGAMAAIPVGVTFVAISQVRKHKLKNRIGGLNIISESIMGSVEPTQFDELLKKLVVKHPEVTEEGLARMIVELNDSRALCDGTVSNSLKIKLASPKQIFEFLDAQLTNPIMH